MLAAFVALAAIVILDLVDGRVGLLFSLGFIMTAVTAPLAVHVDGMRPLLALPPVLLVVMLLAISVVRPEALPISGLPDSASWFARTLSAFVKHGVVLAIAYALAVAATLWRHRTTSVNAAH